MVKALDAIKFAHIDDVTTVELAAAIAELKAMPLHTYGLSFGGLIVSGGALAAYKAEYAAKLTGLLKAKLGITAAVIDVAA